MTLEQLKKQLADGEITQEQYNGLLKIYGLEDDPKGDPKPDEELEAKVKAASAAAVQQEADRVRNEYAQKLKAKEAELEKLQKEKMTADELKAHEVKQQQEALAEERRQVQLEKNKMHAIKAVKKAGLDDGSEQVLDLIDVIVAGAEDEITIDKRVEKFNGIVQSFVKKQVEVKFKESGYDPGKGSGSGSTTKNPFSKEHFNLTEQGKLFKENPELAKQLQAQAK